MAEARRVPSPLGQPGPRLPRNLTFAGLVLALLMAGCSALSVSPAPAGPLPFPDIADELGRAGITVQSWTSGDAGCDDATLNSTAIRFTAAGLDQQAPVTLRIYIFANRAAWDRRLADVDTCVAAWATDPAAFEIVQTSPYVLAGQGPWGSGFDAALRKTLEASAGTGG